jgi:hypothetical protein
MDHNKENNAENNHQQQAQCNQGGHEENQNNRFAVKYAKNKTRPILKK